MQERKDFLTVIFLIDHLEVEIFIGSWSIKVQELKVITAAHVFEKVSLMTDEATICVTCSEYFFWCCKELETIFYHYSENHVKEVAI